MTRPTILHTPQHRLRQSHQLQQLCLRLRLRQSWRVCRGAKPHQAHLPWTRSVASVSVPRPPKVFPSISSTAPHLQTTQPYLQTATFNRSTTCRSYSSNNMATVQFQKVTTSPGNGTQKPKQGDNVTMQYTGYLYDDSKADKKGRIFDSSREPGRDAFKTAIGVGRVIQGWDVGVVDMTVGEKATLYIPAEMGYGARGFPGHIPPNSPLIFDVELVKIN